MRPSPGSSTRMSNLALRNGSCTPGQPIKCPAGACTCGEPPGRRHQLASCSCEDVVSRQRLCDGARSVRGSQPYCSQHQRVATVSNASAMCPASHALASPVQQACWPMSPISCGSSQPCAAVPHGLQGRAAVLQATQQAPGSTKQQASLHPPAAATPSLNNSMHVGDRCDSRYRA